MGGRIGAIECALAVCVVLETKETLMHPNLLFRSRIWLAWVSCLVTMAGGPMPR